MNPTPAQQTAVCLQNDRGCGLCEKGWLARRNEGEYPSWVFDRGVTKPDSLARKNPLNGGVFRRESFAVVAVMARCGDTPATSASLPTKTPRRRTASILKTRPKTFSCRQGFRGQTPMQRRVHAQDKFAAESFSRQRFWRDVAVRMNHLQHFLHYQA